MKLFIILSILTFVSLLMAILLQLWLKFIEYQEHKNDKKRKII